MSVSFPLIRGTQAEYKKKTCKTAQIGQFKCTVQFSQFTGLYFLREKLQDLMKIFLKNEHDLIDELTKNSASLPFYLTNDWDATLRRCEWE